MPWGGCIKRFKPTGFKFSNDKYTNFADLLSGSSTLFQIPAFTLVVVKITGEVFDLGTLFVDLDILFFGHTYSDEQSPYGNEFKPNIPGKVEIYKINAGDILNIRSEINAWDIITKEAEWIPLPPTGKFKFPVSGGMVRYPDDYFDNDDFDNEFFTYPATILIGLDPF